ncbi:hypothetical protein OOZ15_05280 [Galbibacter sp. EGI 63066]|uniref:hypothetical protein n=1 Tax=Galbibacter sp. EGI 63066 TaxID=2993559 RepID=UPI002248D425|nr:hypothetical protein [Galbibacter sp. EGI 63066]MCX2679348.1 hypothetical protein [Galbibacter sp. EGI 63066]
MKKSFSLLLLLCIVVQLGHSQNQTVKTVTVDDAGWKRVALLNGAYGRGYNELTLLTTGGANAPHVAKISWFKGWSNYGGLNIVSVSRNGYWSDARITFDGTYAYLEINFTTQILHLKVLHDQSAWNSGAIIEGTLPTGGGEIITQAKFGRVNFSEDDFYLAYNGNLGLGTTSTGPHKLAVEGSIGAREVKIQASGWSDFVFDNDYNLPTLKEVEQHIKEKGHLKDIPSAREVEENGIYLGEMDAKLLQKIEELTLYTIEQEEKIKKQEEKLLEQQREIKQLKKQNKRIDQLEDQINQLLNTIEK